MTRSTSGNSSCAETGSVFTIPTPLMGDGLFTTTDLGCMTNEDVIKQFVSLEEKNVLDVGCGSMTFTKVLAGLGASVLALDPDSVQAESNRKAPPIPNVEFVEAAADQLPAGDDSVDGVFFAYSLHHIPKELYPQVFSEVRRVLKPDGFLYVIEPIDCPLNEVMKLFYDEDQQRADAQLALRELAVPHFISIQSVTNHGYTVYESFDQFADRFAEQAFDSIYSETDVRDEKVREAFERLGGPERRFSSPKTVLFLKGLKGKQ